MKRKLKTRVHAKRKSAAVRTPKKPHTGHTPHRAEHGQTPEEEKQRFDELLLSQEPERAVDLARSFTRKWPRSALAWSCLASALYTADGDWQEARACFRKALQCDPQYVGARAGMLDLLLSKPETRGEAFAQIQALYRVPSNQHDIPMPGMWADGFNRAETARRVWSGGPAPDKTICLWLGGTGSGDKFLQSRFVPLIRAQCARVVILGASIEEAGILSSVPEVAAVYEEEAWVENRDLTDALWVSGKMALAMFFDTPALPPYLFPDAARVAKWKTKLSSPSLKVGVVWAGGQVTSFGSRRDCPLSAFAALASLSGIDFLSFQKGPSENDPAPPRLQLKRLGPHLDSWADTAAALICCDMLLSVDTGVLHLAGAVGLPVWGIITTKFWSWVFDSGEFYSTLKVFRKPFSASWQPLMQQVAEALRVLAEQHQRTCL